MNISPFGDLRWGDSQGLQYWQQNHNDSHINYARVIAQPVATPDLTGDVDGNWFSMHVLMHQTLQDMVLSAAEYSGIGQPVLIDVHRWTDPEMFYWWHAAHNDLHRNLDQALGLV